MQEDQIKLVAEAADRLDSEEHRYCERFYPCPVAESFGDNPRRYPNGKIVGHEDCGMCEGSGVIEDEDAPWFTVTIDAVREAAAELRQINAERQPKLTLPPYSGDTARCTKCGNTALEEGVATMFGAVPYIDPNAESHTQVGPFVIVGLEPPRKLPTFLDGMPPSQEFLARGCRRCNYVWAEACVDDPSLALDGLR